MQMDPNPGTETRENLEKLMANVVATTHGMLRGYKQDTISF